MARRNRRGRAVHGVLLLDKPSGGSSNHALQRVKRLFGAKKAGHTGSLDPLATGMLPICLGEATKLAAWLIDADKGYETTLRLGVTTDSADADGEVISERALPVGLDRDRFESVCRDFVGEQLQVPPMVSAIKIDGQRLYKLAREGVTVERAARPITISDLQVLEFEGATARLSVHCSKGTYIRSLVTDIGERLGCGAHVTALRRTFVAPFGDGDSVVRAGKVGGDGGEGRDDAGRERAARGGGDREADRGPFAMVTLDTLERLVAEAASPEAGWSALDALLLPPDAGLGHLPEVTLDATSLTRFLHGQAVPFDACDGRAPDGGVRDSGLHARASVEPGSPEADASPPWRVRDRSGRLVGLGRPSPDTREIAPVRVLQWD